MVTNSHHSYRTNPLLNRRAPGVTLTEMLIVIVIIAILVALLFPLAGRMREKARGSACAQNLRQIGIGLLAHISENNGRLPRGNAHVSWLKDEADVPLGISWYDAAAQNIGRGTYSMRYNDPKADPLPPCFGCPSGHGKAYHPAWPYTGDYAANLYLGQPNHQVASITSIEKPESTPYVQDTVKQNNFGAGIYKAGFSKTSDYAFAERHGGKGNILWVDGHVSSLSYDEYRAYANDPKRGGAYNFIRGQW